MHFQHALAVFEVVFRRHGCARQFSFLADQHEGLFEVVGQGHAEEKAPRLGPDDGVEVQVFRQMLHRVDREPQALRVLNHGGHVPKQDAGLREIGNGDDGKGNSSGKQPMNLS